MLCDVVASSSAINLQSVTGFSFEAGGRTFRPVVRHSTSGTLRSILAIFFYYGAKKTFTSGAFRSMSATLQNS